MPNPSSPDADGWRFLRKIDLASFSGETDPVPTQTLGDLPPPNERSSLKRLGQGGAPLVRQLFMIAVFDTNGDPVFSAGTVTMQGLKIIDTDPAAEEETKRQLIVYGGFATGVRMFETYFSTDVHFGEDDHTWIVLSPAALPATGQLRIYTKAIPAA